MSDQRQNGAPRDRWPPWLQFVFDVSGDTERQRGFVSVMRTLVLSLFGAAAAVVLALVGVAAVLAGLGFGIYLVVQLHVPLWSKIGVPTGAVSVVSVGGWVISLWRHARRARRVLRQRPTLPAKAAALPEPAGQEQDRGLRGPGEGQGEHGGDPDPGADARPAGEDG